MQLLLFMALFSLSSLKCAQVDDMEQEQESICRSDTAPSQWQLQRAPMKPRYFLAICSSMFVLYWGMRILNRVLEKRISSMEGTRWVLRSLESDLSHGLDISVLSLKRLFGEQAPTGMLEKYASRHNFKHKLPLFMKIVFLKGIIYEIASLFIDRSCVKTFSLFVEDCRCIEQTKATAYKKILSIIYSLVMGVNQPQDRVRLLYHIRQLFRLDLDTSLGRLHALPHVEEIKGYMHVNCPEHGCDQHTFHESFVGGLAAFYAFFRSCSRENRMIQDTERGTFTCAH